MATSATRRHVLKGAAGATVALPSTLHAGSAQRVNNPVAAKAAQVMDRAFHTKPAPALSIAVAGADGLLWADAAGQADLELGTAATTAHRFPLGSVSKVFTAVIAAKLATRGTLDLDTAISRWMPDLPEQHRRTTLRQLLTHRAGIRHYDKAEPDVGSPGGAIYMRLYPTDADVLGLFIDDPLVAEPGAEVRYSSYGYTLASMVMAAAAERPFLDLVEQEVARPFGLSSLTPDDPWLVTEARAGRYMNDLDIKMLFASVPDAARPRLTNGWSNMPFGNPAYCWAGAGLVMTPSDTARFGAAMLASAGSPLTPEQHALLFTPVTAATKNSPPLGLGWRIDTDENGRRRWHHAGATPGGCNLLAVYPDQGLSVALAGNVMTMKLNVLQTAAEIIDAFTSA